jgi:hypothetical protein
MDLLSATCCKKSRATVIDKTGKAMVVTTIYRKEHVGGNSASMGSGNLVCLKFMV